MSVESIREDMIVPGASPEKDHFETERELMEAIGRTAVRLFALMNQAAALSPLPSVAVIQENQPFEPLPPTFGETDTNTEEDILLAIEEAISPESSAPSAEQIERMIRLYEEQIQFYADAATRERKALESEEKVRLLRQLSSQQIAAALNNNTGARIERLRTIADYEEKIKQMQQNIEDLKRH